MPQIRNSGQLPFIIPPDLAVPCGIPQTRPAQRVLSVENPEASHNVPTESRTPVFVQHSSPTVQYSTIDIYSAVKLR